MPDQERIRELFERWQVANGRIAPEDICVDFPELLGAVRERIELARQVVSNTAQTAPANDEDASPVHMEFEERSPQIEGYTVLRRIGGGGQGIVFQAIQLATHRKVAIKVLLEGPYDSKTARKRFEREVDLAANLKHPHIITIFDSGITRDGRLFYVMDYVRGVPITQHVREQKLHLTGALELFAMACDAVNHAHQKGVIHRDLKPSNLLVDAEGNLRILDFGLAKQVTDSVQTVVSVTGQIVGTVPYMSPEQAKANPDLIDTRTDVYSLGVVLYEMLTGVYPYPVGGGIADVLKHISETQPRPLTRSWTKESGIADSAKAGSKRCPIDDEVETIALKALSKERERRYQSAGELAVDIRHYLRGEPIEAKRDSGIYQIRKFLKRYRMAASVVAGFMLLLAAATVVSVMLTTRARRAEAKARDLESRSDKMAALYEDAIKRLSEQALAEGRLKDGFFAVDVVGLVQVRERPEQPWTNVRVGMILAEGAEVRTGPKSRVTVFLPPNQIVTQDQLGTARFRRADVAAAVAKSPGEIAKYGKVKYQVDGGGLEHEVMIRNPSNALAIRG